MRNIFIHGIETLLGSYFAARCLQNSNDRIYFFPGAAKDTICELVTYAASQINSEKGESQDETGRERLQPASSGDDVNPAEGPAEAWWFASAKKQATDPEALDCFLALCSSNGAKEFNYVAFDFIGGKAARILSQQELSKRCATKHIQYRIFLVSSVVGAGHPNAQYPEILPQFLSALFSLKAEIEERSPKYFDFQALRCLTPNNAAVNLMPVNVAVDSLLRIASTDGATDATFPVFSTMDTPVWVLCESIGIAYNVSFLAVKDRNALNAIDRMLSERFGGLEEVLISGTPGKPAESYAKNFSTEGVPLDEEAQIELFEAIRRTQDEALAVRNRRASELPDRLERKTIKRNGLEFHYYAGGSKGTPVIMLNALGQGLHYWHRLLDQLIENHRVIIWEPRGTEAPPPPFGFTEQVDDLAAVVEHEKIESCHLIGWCTGPKVAIEFTLYQPSVVRSMAFLNTSLKCDGESKELDSPYEHSMDSLCRMVVRKPTMAGSVMTNLQAETEDDETAMLEGNDSEQTSVSVLSRRNIRLKCDVLAAFKTEATTANYAHQLVDFWKHDVRAKAREIKVPVLLISAEYDQVATPEASIEAAKLFTNARHVHVKGATHYCLYDRPEFIAGLLKAFFANPVDMPVPGPPPEKALHAVQTQAPKSETSPASNLSGRVAYGS